MPAGSLFVATTQPQLARLRARQHELDAIGVGEEDSRVLGPAEANAVVGVEGCLEASYSPHCARVDPAPQTRLQALTSLGELGPAAREAVPALLQMLKDRGNPQGNPNTLSTGTARMRQTEFKHTRER